MSKPEKMRRIRERPDGRIWWEFWRGDDRHEIKAAACVSKTFRDANAADAWALARAVDVCVRLDYSESDTGRKATAIAERETLIAEIATAETRRAKIERDYPDLIEAVRR